MFNGNWSLKKKLDEKDLKNIIYEIKEKKISGINVTVPFKKTIIPFLEELTPEANETQSVNMIYLNNEKVIGHNTDIEGFELGIKHCKFDVKDKKVFIQVDFTTIKDKFIILYASILMMNLFNIDVIKIFKRIFKMFKKDSTS